jgi:hypothetical protein
MIMSMRQRRPGFIDHANVIEWPERVKKVQEIFPSCLFEIPGHGPHGDIRLLEHTRGIL